MKSRLFTKWTDEELTFLVENYPRLGKAACVIALNRSEGAVRSRASTLGLKADDTSEFASEWQARAAQSKVGKKRPDQAAVMKRSHDQGKMKQTPEQRALAAEQRKLWYQHHEHPRGMLGKQHTPAAKNAMATSSKKRWHARSKDQNNAIVLKRAKTREANGTQFNQHGSWKAGWRTVGGRNVYFRSRWEANYARWLEWLKSIGNIIEWEHEPETFWFDGVRRGCVSYLPDFRITNPNGTIEYHEVKGWMDDRSKTKIRRMKKYHPKVKLLVIDAKSYRKLAGQIGKSIREWE